MPQPVFSMVSAKVRRIKAQFLKGSKSMNVIKHLRIKGIREFILEKLGYACSISIRVIVIACTRAGSSSAAQKSTRARIVARNHRQPITESKWSWYWLKVR